MLAINHVAIMGLPKLYQFTFWDIIIGKQIFYVILLNMFVIPPSLIVPFLFISGF